MTREPIPPEPAPYPGSAQPVGPGAPPPRRGRGPWWTGILGVIVGIAAVLLIFWVIDVVAGDDDDLNEEQVDQTLLPGLTAPEDVLAVQTVMTNTDDYLGEEVTVGGTLRAAVSPGLAYFGGAVYETESLLLLTDDPAPATFPAAADARATGTLTRLDIAEAEEALGVDLDEDLLDDFEGDVTLLAESVHYFISGEFGTTSLIDLTEQEVTYTGRVDEQVSERVFLADDILIVVQEGVEFDEAAATEDAIIRAHGIGSVVTEDLDPAVSTMMSEEQIDEYLGLPMLITDAVEFIPD